MSLRLIFFYLCDGGRFQHSILWVDSLYSFAVFLFMFLSGLLFVLSFVYSYMAPDPSTFHTSSFVSRFTHAMPSIFFSFLLLLPCMCLVSFFYFCWSFRFRWAIFFCLVHIFHFASSSFIPIICSLCKKNTDTGAWPANTTLFFLSLPLKFYFFHFSRRNFFFRFVIKPFIMFVIGSDFDGSFDMLMTWKIEKFQCYSKYKHTSLFEFHRHQSG